MSLKDSLQIALLLAIGYLLRLIIPGYAAGMKPDPMMGMLIVIILMHRNIKVTFMAGAVAGLIGAFTTTFPGGQIPYMIDKALTSFFILLLVYIVAVPLEKFFAKGSLQFMGVKSTIGTFLSCGIIGLVATLFSGVVFLASALAIVGIPAPFKVLFATVVVPAAIANAVVVMVLYPLVTLSKNMIGMTRPQGTEQA